MRRSRPRPEFGARRVPGCGWRLARVAGIDIHLHTSLLVIFLLIAFTLGTGLFPRLEPGAGVGRRGGRGAAVFQLGAAA